MCLKGCEHRLQQSVAKRKFQLRFAQGFLCTSRSALTRIIKFLGPERIHSEEFRALIWGHTLFPVVTSANTAIIYVSYSLCQRLGRDSSHETVWLSCGLVSGRAWTLLASIPKDWANHGLKGDSSCVGAQLIEEVHWGSALVYQILKAKNQHRTLLLNATKGSWRACLFKLEQC